MDTLSYLSNAEIGFIDGLYTQYQQDPESVAYEWKRFFEGFTFARSQYNNGQTAKNAGVADSPEHIAKEISVVNLINAYRSRGHLFAKTNPILPRRDFQPTLAIENFGLAESDLDQVFVSGSELGIGARPLRAIVAHLEATYCGTIGIEYRYIRNPRITGWFEERIEGSKMQPNFDTARKKTILEMLGKSSSFEQFLHRKFVGQKRFSLEGAESVIPALHAIIEEGADLGI
ncbi:MAG: 2-oxoglutarate dehydrogenase E1 subunit family protein, partial [Sphingobacteriia bacterium]